MRSGDSTTVDVPESSSVPKGKATLVTVAKQKGGWKRGVAIFDFILRLGAIVAALAAASTMGTSDETLPFFTQFFQFQASYDDLPTFQYVISLPLISLFLCAVDDLHLHMLSTTYYYEQTLGTKNSCI